MFSLLVLFSDSAAMDHTKFAAFIILVLVFFFVSYPNLTQPEETVTLGFFKILPMLTLIYTVTQTPEVDEVHAQQMKHFKYGLIFSVVGDIFMNWKSAHFIPAMGMFALAQLFYIRSFRLKPTGYEAASFCFTSGFVSFMFLLPGIKERGLQTAVFIYGGLVMAVWWRTIVRWQTTPSLINMLGVFGGLSFAVSDFIIGLDTWKFPKRVPYAFAMIMTTYYLAQLLLTLSVVNYGWTYFREYDLREKKKG